MSAQSPPYLFGAKTDDLLPSLEVEISLTALVIYAAATWDFHRYHYDPALAAAAGAPGPFMDGQMAGGLMARHAMALAGPDAFVRRMSFRLRNMVYAGERIVIGGRVAGVREENGLKICELECSVVKPDGIEVVRGAKIVVEMPT